MGGKGVVGDWVAGVSAGVYGKSKSHSSNMP